MKTQFLLKSAMVVVLSLSAIAMPAEARGHKKKDDHRHGKHKHHKHHHHHRYGYRTPVRVMPPRVVVTRPLVVHQARPAYGVTTEMAVQRELARRGYYRGVIDGQVGPQTRASIRAWQVDRGLPVTGRVDGHLLRSLRLA